MIPCLDRILLKYVRHMQISAFRVDKFKRLASLEVALSDITVLIGGNNAGKSSLLQGVHLAITTLQSARSASSKAQPASTLGVDQFLYKPSNEPIRLHHKTDMTSKSGPEFTFTYKEAHGDDPKNFALSMRRGKNANIAIAFDHKNGFYQRSSDRARPLSIFVPGLAGVALSEERRTDAIVTAGIAQGDANLYLRNVLLRITLDQQKLERFHSIIGEVFPDLKISCNFDEQVHTSIEILVHIDGIKVPLELVGAGTLQAIQLVAYATMYDPGLLLLDEPDAHLHPSNQRLLATTLLKIAEQGSAKIILATHSRHIFDALTRSSMTDVVWLKHGVKQTRKENQDLSILLDLGALDSYELLTSARCRVIVLTEDSKMDRLRTILEANGFKPDEYMIQPYDGVSNITMSAVVADFFLKQGNDTHVLVHRDGDCMLADEVAWYTATEKEKLPDRCELFVTPLTDIEHQFCKPDHLATSLEISLVDAGNILAGIIAANNASLAGDFANKRAELKNKALRAKENVPSAADLMGAQIAFEQVKGKRLFGLLNVELQQLGHNPMRVLTSKTDALKIDQLRTFSERVWPPAAPGLGGSELPASTQ
jgi:predicted ATPase